MHQIYIIYKHVFTYLDVYQQSLLQMYAAHQSAPGILNW